MTRRDGNSSDLSGDRWDLIEPVLAAWRTERCRHALGRPPGHDLRQIRIPITLCLAVFFVTTARRLGRKSRPGRLPDAASRRENPLPRHGTHHDDAPPGEWSAYPGGSVTSLRPG